MRIMLTVKDIMITSFVSLPPDMKFFDAVSLFVKNRISGAPVIDEQGKLLGVISEKDLFRAMYPSYQDFYVHPERYLDSWDDIEELAKEARDKTVGELMSKRIISTKLATPVLKIGGVMIATGVHRIPVVENNKVVGMVSRGDTYRAILQEKFNLYALKS